MGYVTVSAKVPRRLKELLDKYGVKPGPVIRMALEEEVRRRVLEELEREARGHFGNSQRYLTRRSPN